jgi:hypothetical protein
MNTARYYAIDTDHNPARATATTGGSDVVSFRRQPCETKESSRTVDENFPRKAAGCSKESISGGKKGQAGVTRGAKQSGPGQNRWGILKA